MKRAALGLTLILVLGACGGSAGDEATTTTSATTTAPTTTSPVTSTTAATTTTEATTTTLPADAHPVFGVSWASVFPEPGETAIYRVTRLDGTTVELPAHFEYGVDFRGATVDRLVVGTAEPGNEGWALYFDRSEPWVLAVIASEIYYPQSPNGPGFVESFVDPVRFDGTMDIGESREFETTITLEFEGGVTDDLGVIYRMNPAAIEDEVEVPFGVITEVLRLEAEVGGELIGTSFIDVTLWLHPDHTLVRFLGPPPWEAMELVETWG
jgi:hypothetical protein